VRFLDRLLDGVRVAWCPLGAISEIKKGTSVTRKQVQTGTVPVIAGGKKPAYFHNIANRSGNIITVSASGTAGFVNYFSQPIFASDCHTIRSKDENVVMTKFIYQFLKSRQEDIYKLKRGLAQPHLYAKDLNSIKVPIPCPENRQKSSLIQREIVRILDKFTGLIATLTRELALRQRQYAYYRDKLLELPQGKVTWKRLGEIAHYSKTRIRHDQLDATNYVGVDNLLQDRAGKVASHYVPVAGNLTQYHKGDILIGNIRPYLKKIWYADCLGGTNGDVLVIHNRDKTVKARYLYHLLSADQFFNYMMRHVKGAKMPRGNKAKIMEYRMAIPSMAEQIRIIAILDKFDILTHSISEGLPGEIKLRQKQYEYYQNALLDFPQDLRI